MPTAIRRTRSLNDVYSQPFLHKCSENGIISVHINPGLSIVTKIVHLECAKPEYGERLSHEADILRRLHHNNIVQYYRHTLCKKGALHLVMEYVPGVDLIDYATLHHAPTIATLCHIMSQLLSALKYLHAQNIAHCDIKPDNILVTQWDHVKLIDFGCAVVCEPGMSDFTKKMSAVGMGTTGYSAPEVRMGHVCLYNPMAADVYSLMVTIGVVLCGQFDENEQGQYNPNDALDFAPRWLATLMIKGLNSVAAWRPSMSALLSEFVHQTGKRTF